MEYNTRLILSYRYRGVVNKNLATQIHSSLRLRVASRKYIEPSVVRLLLGSFPYAEALNPKDEGSTTPDRQPFCSFLTRSDLYHINFYTNARTFFTFTRVFNLHENFCFIPFSVYAFDAFATCFLPLRSLRLLGQGRPRALSLGGILSACTPWPVTIMISWCIHFTKAVKRLLAAFPSPLI